MSGLPGTSARTLLMTSVDGCDMPCTSSTSDSVPWPNSCLPLPVTTRKGSSALAAARNASLTLALAWLQPPSLQKDHDATDGWLRWAATMPRSACRPVARRSRVSSHTTVPVASRMS